MSSPKDNIPSHNPFKPQPVDEGFREAERGSSMNVARVHTTVRREKTEPMQASEPVPLWLMTLFALVAFFAGGYLLLYSGGFRGDVYSEVPLWGEAPDGEVRQVAGPGRGLYTNNCMVCHQQDGMGLPNVYPPLAGSEWVVGPPNRTALIVLHGMYGPIEVRGNMYNGRMDPFGRLDDSQIAAILTYIRTSWGNDASPISEEFVAALRAEHSPRPAWTAPELQAVPPMEDGGPAEANGDEAGDEAPSEEEENDAGAEDAAPENGDGAQPISA